MLRPNLDGGRDRDDFFKDAQKMQSQTVKSSWKSMLVTAVVSITGIILFFTGIMVATIAIKVIFFQ